MKATVKDFFASNLEQEVLDEVPILPHLTENYRRGFAKDISSTDFTEFESVEIGLSAYSGEGLYATFTVDSTTLKKPEWLVSSVVSNGTGTSRANVRVAKNATSLTVSCTDHADALIEAGVKYMVGYKRRISRVGIDELMSAMSLPNLIANADLTSSPINQRNFNGDWSSLAVGAYGYDQWMKVSSTHMGCVVEAEKYRPSTKHTLTKDDVVLGEFMSPASGHWIVAVPFATTGKYDLYAGQFKRPWHPVQDGLERCLRYYQKGLDAEEYLTSLYRADAPFGARGIIHLPVTLRKIANALTVTSPRWFSASKGSWITSNVTISLLQRVSNNIRIDLSYDSVGTPFQSVIVSFGYSADASITLAEVGGQITTIG